MKTFPSEGISFILIILLIASNIFWINALNNGETILETKVARQEQVIQKMADLHLATL
jgi:hypothetical protein